VGLGQQLPHDLGAGRGKVLAPAEGDHVDVVRVGDPQESRGCRAGTGLETDTELGTVLGEELLTPDGGVLRPVEEARNGVRIEDVNSDDLDGGGSGIGRRR
jgi:hypothetical protein